MDGSEQMPTRDADGRFVPGQSGNPAGKKPGTRNRATVLREALADGEETAAARIVIDRALAGDAVAARFIVERLTVTRVLDGRLRALKAAAREEAMQKSLQKSPSPLAGEGGARVQPD